MSALRDHDAAFASALKEFVRDPKGRFVLAEFLERCGVDRSAIGSSEGATAHAVGLQDAGRWFLDLMRLHSPDSEMKMRIEHKQRYDDLERRIKQEERQHE